MTTTKLKGKQVSVPHGTFYSLATQAIANVANVQAVALEKDADLNGLTHDKVTNNDRIYVPYTGSYLITFSGISDLSAAPGNKHICIWPTIDGTAVTDSNTRVEIANATQEMTVAVSFILNVTAGHYISFQTWGDATTVEWLATAAAAGPTRPAVPSVIITVNMINAY